MKVTDKYVFFWSGIYSQWYKAPMVIDDKLFNTCEQYMMYSKAMLFNDTKIAEKILEDTNPKVQKQLGRQVKNFDKSVWDRKCLSIVYKGNLAKFKQHPGLLSQMMETGNKIFVEASPLDNIWGIGLAENDKNIENPEYWKGLNLLGIALTMVKKEISFNLVEHGEVDRTAR